MPSSLTLFAEVGSRLVSIVSVPAYFCAAVGVKVTETSQLPAGVPLDFGPRSSSLHSLVRVNGLVTPVSISIRIGRGTFFPLTLPPLAILIDLILFEPSWTSPNLSTVGEILSLPTTGVGVAVGVAEPFTVAVAVGVAVPDGVADAVCVTVDVMVTVADGVAVALGVRVAVEVAVRVIVAVVEAVAV
jgi:hypothetical protein